AGFGLAFWDKIKKTLDESGKAVSAAVENDSDETPPPAPKTTRPARPRIKPDTNEELIAMREREGKTSTPKTTITPKTNTPPKTSTPPKTTSVVKVTPPPKKPDPVVNDDIPRPIV